jgi:hypothetical protein
MALRRLRQYKEAQQLAAQESQNLCGFLCLASAFDPPVYRVMTASDTKEDRSAGWKVLIKPDLPTENAGCQ